MSVLLPKPTNYCLDPDFIAQIDRLNAGQPVQLASDVPLVVTNGGIAHRGSCDVCYCIRPRHEVTLFTAQLSGNAFLSFIDAHEVAFELPTIGAKGHALVTESRFSSEPHQSYVSRLLKN
jgi:hypothetical protein